MSRNNQYNERTHARRSRHARPNANANRPERSRDERVLASLPYRKGHLTDQELTLFAELRGDLSPMECEQLGRVAGTLRRPFKRLRALDLMRHWGLPLTRARHRMLPWFAGLTWHRPLPNNSAMQPVVLARHLLCSQDVPEFLMEPFAHPEPHASASLQWELCRILATVGSGGGLVQLREINNFWTWVPPGVFERFVETPPGVPVLEGLIHAFVQSWGGPIWLAQQAYSWTSIRSLEYGLPPVLQVVHGLCQQSLSQEQVEQVGKTRLGAVPKYSRLFGESRKLPIPNSMPVELAEWHSYELRTPEDFEAEDARADRMVSYSFQEAQRGEVSFWSLRREDQCITVRVDVSRMRAWQIGTYRRPRDPEEGRVLGLWARANGLEV